MSPSEFDAIAASPADPTVEYLTPAESRRAVCGCPRTVVDYPPRSWRLKVAHAPGCDRSLKPTPAAERTAGWSRGAVIPCPACGNRCYSAGPAGLPERRCDGPAGCGHVFNPEADVRPPLRDLVGPDPRRPRAAALVSTDPEE
jgi:hypothetical protein